MNMMKKNIWDKVVKIFDISKREIIDPYAADNIEIAWPLVLKIIKKNYKKNSKILDYGCGTGGFIKKLAKEGYNSLGIDSSKKMIQIAKKNYSNLKFIFGNKKELCQFNNHFDAISCIMVVQFVKNIRPLIKSLKKTLKKKGKIILVTFNPDFVKECINKKKLFKKTEESLKVDLVLSKNIIIKTYVRNIDQYKRIFGEFGFKFDSIKKPLFTKKFVKEHKWPLPYKVPEYLIMEFTKK